MRHLQGNLLRRATMKFSAQSNLLDLESLNSGGVRSMVILLPNHVVLYRVVSTIIPTMTLMITLTTLAV